MLEIAVMKAEHIDGVLLVEEACFHIAWTKADFKREINENKMAIYRVALVDGKVVGYAGMWHVVNEGQITNVAVLPEYRRCGIGDAIIEEFIKIAKEHEMIGITLEVKISNMPAQKLYTKYGFKPEGFRKNYYKDTNEDAVIMWKYFENYEGYNKV
ncbi:MAG TPA: ribosomal-protein-alanine N-acetyltransferase [Lachnospiraceae bacterium]|nr:ribosomal-protein-alanine N-acetyltransferase [Lachnospiraceae bacterium]